MNQRFLWRMTAVVLTIAIILPLFSTTPTLAQSEETLYVALIWHQHQPVYYQDPVTNVYNRPWVRAHAAKDYLDMATMLEAYPDVHVTFNYTPSLIRQLKDVGAGAKDLYWVMAEIPAEDLTASDKQFILERFFDTNRRIIARFPRYHQLLTMRDDTGIDAAIENWTAQDFRDLQVLFNLAWTDPDWLAEEPLAALVAQGEGFAEEDKKVVFDEHLRIVNEVIPYHAAMQETGQIEVTMTPFAHPILPLLVDTNAAAIALPEAELPNRFVFGQDAVAQVNLGAVMYEEYFGRVPRGMWPAEGSVSPQIVQMVASAGINWMATDEDVLARSLPEIDDFTRNSADTVQQADALYRPYLVTGGRGGEVAVFFRDHLISDRLGFEYSGTPGEAAATDLMQRLNAIQDQLQAEGAEGPHVVTILLDGENAWEHYANDGKDFLNAMYRNFAEADNIQAVTPSEFLEISNLHEGADELREIETIWSGSWITPDYSTWIGEAEENTAWNYLLETRQALQEAEPRLSADTKQAAFEAMYIAEGSDWFWYYGADQDSGQDWAFDEQFRGHLQRVYDLISVPAPSFVYIPVIPQNPQPVDRAGEGSVRVTVDGIASDDEWGNAPAYIFTEEAISGLAYGFDDTAFNIRIDTDWQPGQTYSFYLNTPDSLPTNAYTRYEEEGDRPLLGFGAQRLLEISIDADGIPSAELYDAAGGGSWVPAEEIDTVAVGDGLLEIGIPMETLSPAARSGNQIVMRLVVSAGEQNLTVAPPDGPAAATLPDTAVPNIILDVQDPTGDDHGAGDIVYPSDVVFRNGAYDATSFTVGYDDQAVVFRIHFRGPIENDWGAPNGMGIHTVDVYIDVDGAENGTRLLLPGRNAALPEDAAWDYAIWAEGWTPGVYRPGEDGPVQIDGQFTILTNPGQRRVTIRVPRSMIPGDPTTWSFAAIVAGQEGYPSSGVWRIRDVIPAREQWRFGGAPAGTTNHSRVIDVIYAEEGLQESRLNDYPRASGNIDDMTADEFGQIPVIIP